MTSVNKPIFDDDYVVLKRRLAEMQSEQPGYLNLSEKKEKEAKAPVSVSLLTKTSSSKGIRNKSDALNPPLKTTPTLKRRYGFVASTAGTNVYNVTGASLAGALGAIVYIANTSARAVVGLARIRLVSAWPAQSGTTTNNACDLRWSNGPLATIVDDEDTVELLPVGITQTRCIRFTPPNHSLAGDWMNLANIATGVLFTAELSFGSIVYVDVDMKMFNNFTGATVALTTTAVVGTSGYTPLNGSGGGLLPIGVDITL